ncbi:MAG: hypothetical protein ABI650_12000, partial [Dokdonella sp.]
PSPVGIAELIAATEVTAGSIWRVHGRVSAVESGSLELVDRAGEIVSRSTLDSEGRFVFDAALRTAGISRFVMRVVAADGQVIEQMPVEVVVRNGDRLRVLLIAGAPDAELKYLRRWAVDAGVEFGVRMAVSRGIALRDGIDRLDAESLGKSDLLIADERSWSALSVLEKNAVREAVGQGLGLLLRVTGPVPASVRSEWAALGLRVDAADIERTITLPALEGGLGAALELARRPLSVVGDDVASLLVTNEGTSLALWRAQGRGRIAVWWLADSYRLVLGGNAQRFGTLWSGAMRTIARADAPSITKLSQRAWIGQRSVICGIGDDTTVEASDHTRTVLRIDPHTPGCAAFWPVLAGWHRVADGEAGVTFFVHDAQQAPALAHADTVLATQRVVLAARAGASAAATKPAPRWPFFLAWLLVAAVVWWSERKQHS